VLINSEQCIQYIQCFHSYCDGPIYALELLGCSLLYNKEAAQRQQIEMNTKTFCTYTTLTVELRSAVDDFLFSFLSGCGFILSMHTHIIQIQIHFIVIDKIQSTKPTKHS